jgi:plasmid stabilization system protein ParE
MKSYRVVFTPEAEFQITDLYRYIATQASPAVAARYTDDLVTFCEGLTRFPHRGIQRDDIRPGLRITSHKKRTAIAFVVQRDQVAILGVFYGGQNYETVLHENEDEAE